MTISDFGVPSMGATLWPHGKGKSRRRRGLRYVQLVLMSLDRSRANTHPQHTLVVLRDAAHGAGQHERQADAGERDRGSRASSAPRPSVWPASSSTSSTTTWRPKLMFRLCAPTFRLPERGSTRHRSQPCAPTFRLRKRLNGQIAAGRADLVLVEHRLTTRLGGLAVVLSGLLFAALRYWPPH